MASSLNSFNSRRARLDVDGSLTHLLLTPGRGPRKVRRRSSSLLDQGSCWRTCCANEDGVKVTASDIEALARWARSPPAHGEAAGDEAREIAFTPARVLMQDLTGVPAVVDLAAMRDAIIALGSEAKKINPLVPVELVIDHSVIVERNGTAIELRRERRDRVPAQHGALHLSQVGPELVRAVPRRASGHGDLPPGEPRALGEGGLRTRRGGVLRHPGRYRLTHHHDQRTRRARLGRRGH